CEFSCSLFVLDVLPLAHAALRAPDASSPTPPEPCSGTSPGPSPRPPIAPARPRRGDLLFARETRWASRVRRVSATRAPHPLRLRAQSVNATRIRNLLARVSGTRGARPHGDNVPERFHNVERVTTTAFGR